MLGHAIDAGLVDDAFIAGRTREFDAVKAMAAKARTENEALEKRVAALEQALADKQA